MQISDTDIDKIRALCCLAWKSLSVDFYVELQAFITNVFDLCNVCNQRVFYYKYSLQD